MKNYFSKREKVKAINNIINKAEDIYSIEMNEKQTKEEQKEDFFSAKDINIEENLKLHIFYLISLLEIRRKNNLDELFIEEKFNNILNLGFQAFQEKINIITALLEDEEEIDEKVKESLNEIKQKFENLKKFEGFDKND